jgi:uncharacterized protein
MIDRIGDDTVKYVLFYDSADDLATKAPAVFPAHQARWADFLKDGSLLMIGPFAEAQSEGSMAIFRTREAADAFATSDPFVLEGVVKRWRVQAWNEVLVP